MTASSVRWMVFAAAFAARASADEYGVEFPDAARKVLNGFVGKWDYEMVSTGSWVPEGGKEKGTLVSEWVLLGKFVRSTGNGEGTYGKTPIQSQFEGYNAWDPFQKRYRTWTMWSAAVKEGNAGTTGAWGGPTVPAIQVWDEKEKTFFVDMTDPETGHKHKGTTKFVGDDRIEWHGVTTDKDGTVLMDQKGTMKRRK